MDRLYVLAKQNLSGHSKTLASLYIRAGLNKLVYASHTPVQSMTITRTVLTYVYNTHNYIQVSSS